MKTTIEVTTEDIAKGQPCDGSFCPIALACDRLGLVLAVCDTELLDAGCNHVCDLPIEAQQFVRDFDDGRFVAPFCFEVELPEMVSC